MAVINHLTRRVLEGGSSGGISGTAIALIVCLGIIPVIVLVWVVSWLFWCYPYDRSCCCTRRKKKQNDEEVKPMQAVGTSLDSFHQRAPQEKAAYPVPERPSMQFHHTDSGRFNSGNRLTKTDPRLSQHTVDSTQDMHYTQEPKRFV
jgi:hypothetical protein